MRIVVDVYKRQIQRKADPGGQKVCDHPADHRLFREDSDFSGDRKRRKPGDEEAWKEDGRRAENAVRKKSVSHNTESVSYTHLLDLGKEWESG